jgi:ketopantoate reductase
MSDKPCPFLTVQTYSTMKGEMKRHYCTARGLKDILPKTTWKNICLKGETCIIRQNLQDIIEDADAQKYIEALLEEMENRSLRNGYPIEIELIKAKEED